MAFDKDICEAAFGGCHCLETISFPSSLSTIDKAAFIECISLRNIEMPPNIKKIEDMTFAGCDLISAIVARDCVISEKAFWGCQRLTIYRRDTL